VIYSVQKPHPDLFNANFAFSWLPCFYLVQDAKEELKKPKDSPSKDKDSSKAKKDTPTKATDKSSPKTPTKTQQSTPTSEDKQKVHSKSPAAAAAAAASAEDEEDDDDIIVDDSDEETKDTPSTDTNTAQSDSPQKKLSWLQKKKKGLAGKAATSALGKSLLDKYLDADVKLLLKCIKGVRHFLYAYSDIFFLTLPSFHVRW